MDVGNGCLEFIFDSLQESGITDIEYLGNFDECTDVRFGFAGFVLGIGRAFDFQTIRHLLLCQSAFMSVILEPVRDHTVHFGFPLY